MTDGKEHIGNRLSEGKKTENMAVSCSFLPKLIVVISALPTEVVDGVLFLFIYPCSASHVQPIGSTQ